MLLWLTDRTDCTDSFAHATCFSTTEMTDLTDFVSEKNPCNRCDPCAYNIRMVLPDSSLCQNGKQIEIITKMIFELCYIEVIIGDRLLGET